jgi:hypothetical protein
MHETLTVQTIIARADYRVKLQQQWQSQNNYRLS